MKKFQLIHNPAAGDASHSKEKLLQHFQNSDVGYVSTEEEDWENFYKNKPNVVFAAGGDGTIGKVARVLLHKLEQQQRPPLDVFPMGTANNISKTFHFSMDKAPVTQHYDFPTTNFDCGKIKGVEEEVFFLESFGFGVFPELIAEMKKNPIEKESPSEKLERTLKVMLKVVKNFQPKKSRIKTEGISIKGSFLMLELMNIKYVGPNIELAPGANPGDGYFELVLVPENKRAAFEQYLRDLIQGTSQKGSFQDFAYILQVQKLKLKSKDSLLHVDGTLVEHPSGKKIKVSVLASALQMIKTP